MGLSVIGPMEIVPVVVCQYLANSQPCRPLTTNAGGLDGD